MKLTAIQQETLEWIRSFVAEQGMPPTVREIGRAFGIKSSTAFERLQALERKGLLRRGTLGARSLEITDPLGKNVCPCWSIPLVGRVAAGQPILAIENIEGRISVDSHVGEGRLFALTIAGESMIEDGILDGDVVIVRQQSTAEDGDIVVALLDGEATVKRFYREAGGKVRLQPANRSMDPIVANQAEVTVQGKVLALQRSL